MARTAALWFFESVNLYHILCPHKVKAWGKDHTFDTYKRNEFIYLPHEPSKYIYLIAEGRIKIGHYAEDGKEVVTSILTKGEIFGELALAGEDIRKNFAQTLEPSKICKLSIEEMKALMYQDKELSFKILKLVGLRLIKLERKLELLVFKDARTRIIEFLRDAASWKGQKVGSETLIPTHLTHKDIAALTGTSRQTVTTVLNELKERNLLTFNRRRILIRDLSKLA